MSDLPQKRWHRYFDENRDAYLDVGHEHLSMPLVVGPHLVALWH
jgi:hypothetical protein